MFVKSHMHDKPPEYLQFFKIFMPTLKYISLNHTKNTDSVYLYGCNVHFESLNDIYHQRMH
jgi:hypothetical protein